MPEAWTGRLVGKMHNNNVNANELAEHLGVCKTYVSMILNGHRNPPNAKERLNAALDEIIEERRKNGA